MRCWRTARVSATAMDLESWPAHRAPLMRDIACDLKASIEYGLAHRAEALAHATAYSRGLDVARTDRFVGMYVNAYTVDYGPTGRRAVAELLGRAHRAGLLSAPVDIRFVTAGT